VPLSSQLTFTCWSIDILNVLVSLSVSKTGEEGAKRVIVGAAWDSVGVGVGVEELF
jgi:hypothetical protein